MGRQLVKDGVFEKEELGFGKGADSPDEAVEFDCAQYAIWIEKVPETLINLSIQIIPITRD